MKAITLNSAKQQCQSPISDDTLKAATDYYHDRRRALAAKKGFDPDCCTRNATHSIDDVPMCALHAGRAALAHIMEPA
ncbi:hypothetical protein LAV_00165 [Sphingobium phage Lacusarx]|uniref:Uncharacterized protein n=1 Tax=Sphingobium phage Lacusarx TaxID=1980139 RepID=A0A1W6DX01_9CAUD|nr:hypothetical protein FDH44_gp138 [Sphingobium phage Lacusarx]ARK07540.1 hypothetical protein LAV_00165 [Sphingobium phage Lacusarx]